MVDMFSLLVIFRCKRFSNSTELVMVSKGVILPTRGHLAATGKDSPLLSLSAESFYLDQKHCR